MPSDSFYADHRCDERDRRGRPMMGKTTVDLFRSGNSASPRMHRVRSGRDAIIKVRNGVEWVKGRKIGVSTSARITNLQGGTWWCLPAGSEFRDDILFVVNDHHDHYAWQPERDMTLMEFKEALATLNQNFLPV
jgi:hypothetical protein